MRASRGIFVVSAALLIFGIGVLVGRLQLFPYRLLKRGFDSAAQTYRERETLLRIRPAGLLQRSRYAGSGVTRHNAAEAAPGLTLISSFFKEGNELRLIRLDGTVVHRWPVRFFQVFKNFDHLSPEDVPRSEWNVTTHGAVALPDGSVVFNFEYLGTAKLDRCGRVQWTVARTSNHSLEQSEDGGFWVPTERYRTDTSPFPILKPPYSEQSITKISPTGEVVREISTLDLLIKNNLASLFLANGLRGAQIAAEDFTHLNDIEELSPRLAPAFPQFRAGDLLLSMRNLNLLLVFDPHTETVKWRQTGPWIAQHDPDFQPTGRISVFNNNDDGTDTGRILGGSTIMEVDPSTGRTTTRYGGTPSAMYSYRRGDHQYLDNGNILIDESEAGRVFEVNRNGDVVWEFINRYDDTRVGVIMGARRYRDDYFTVRDWTCP
jgi:Arylsulfotransferase (ASST)